MESVSLSVESVSSFDFISFISFATVMLLILLMKISVTYFAIQSIDVSLPLVYVFIRFTVDISLPLV